LGGNSPRDRRRFHACFVSPSRTSTCLNSFLLRLGWLFFLFLRWRGLFFFFLGGRLFLRFRLGLFLFFRLGLLFFLFRFLFLFFCRRFFLLRSFFAFAADERDFVADV